MAAQPQTHGLPGFDLSGRRAVVFAGASATGPAVAEALREAGANVTIARTEGAGDVVNVADTAAVERVCADLGALDIAVFVPEMYLAAPIAGTADADVHAVISTNLIGAYNIFRSASKAMATSASGRLITVIPAAALRGLANLSAYSAAHAGIVGLVRSLSQELGARGITVNAIATGWMEDTPGRGPDEISDNQLLRYIPMRRFGSTDEIALLAVYLASAESGYVNGSVMAVDGGVLKHL